MGRLPYQTTLLTKPQHFGIAKMTTKMSPLLRNGILVRMALQKEQQEEAKDELLR